MNERISAGRDALAKEDARLSETAARPQQRSGMSGMSSSGEGALLMPEGAAMVRLGIRDRDVLRAEIKAGNLRYVLVGKRRRYAEADLQEFIERKRRCHDDEAVKARLGATRGKARASGTTTSGSRVLDIEEARRLIAQSRPKRRS